MKKDRREEKEIFTKTIDKERHRFSMKAFEEIIIWAKQILRTKTIYQ